MEDSIYQRIFAAIRHVPFGYVASYSQIAREVGLPRGARLVGWALGSLGSAKVRAAGDIPWQRIVNKEGRVTIRNHGVSPSEQADLLRSEGHVIEQDTQGLYIVAPRWYSFEQSKR